MSFDQVCADKCPFQVEPIKGNTLKMSVYILSKSKGDYF